MPMEKYELDEISEGLAHQAALTKGSARTEELGTLKLLVSFERRVKTILWNFAFILELRMFIMNLVLQKEDR
jgi:hypothetical protein